jgi:XTP/dITP diphosphohydrolase
MKLVFATTNRGKLAELQALVEGLPIEVVSLAAFPAHEVEEDGATLDENATKKALWWRDRTGLAALADDTGLCVDALAGGPGVRSARYADEVAALPGDAEARYRANNEKLLRELASVPLQGRGATFRCALCLAVPGAEPRIVVGECRGRIAFGGRGAKGFGYDPLFELPELGRTFAELSAEEKNRLSHRARAFLALRLHLETLVRP